MSRMQRVRDALTSTVQRLKSQIEESHKKGKIPADYSLGFANALIFAEHQINMREGKPTFYERTTSIGSLPKPMVLKPGAYKDLMGADEIYESMRDAVILAARNWSEIPTAPTADALRKSIADMDAFVTQMEETQNDQETETQQQEVGGDAGKPEQGADEPRLQDAGT